MSDPLATEDPEPLDRAPAGHQLYVPVRSGPAGCGTRFFRIALGCRTAVAFTSRERLVRTLGAGQQWIRPAEPALRALAAPLGVTALRIDPRLTAAPPAPTDRANRPWTSPRRPPGYGPNSPTAAPARTCPCPG